MSGIYGRIINSLFADAAVEKLANSSIMRTLAARTVEVQDAVTAAAAAARANPEGARRAAGIAVAEGTETFLTALRREIAKDLGLAVQPPARAPPSQPR